MHGPARGQSSAGAIMWFSIRLHKRIIPNKQMTGRNWHGWRMPTKTELMQCAQITRWVAGDFEDSLLHNGRADGCATMRQIAMYVICREVGLSTTVIGIMFHRDHSTVVYALKVIELNPRLHQQAIRVQQQFEATYGRP